MTDSQTQAGETDDAGAEAGDGRLPTDEAEALADRIVDNVEDVIVGQRDVIEHILVAVYARGHVLLDDVPGVGKTMLARSIATSVDGSLRRVQFTPDMLPSDVTGVNVFNQKTREFDFRKGPVFANMVLGDEINRAPPKTQAALLEAMEETQVTVDGETRQLPDPFTVIATQNDVEDDRTYDLPLAEIDRFTKKLSLGYPDHLAERELLDRAAGDHPIDSLDPVADVSDLRRARRATAEVTVRLPVREYVTCLAEYTREHAQLGVSPRASIALVRASQARALFDGRDYVVPDDVQREVGSVWTHRIRVGAGTDPASVVEDALSNVGVP
jgi:MoxR-like ATPase